MEDESSIKLIVSGKVQGVSFRWFTVQAARDLRLNGYAKNLADGSVEVRAEGPALALKSLIEKVNQGPQISRVDDVNITWSKSNQEFDHFDIVH
tara:strand:- start:457 stop:738 length:282 start_codon:yes stop_codon:yes gene_type:complete